MVISGSESYTPGVGRVSVSFMAGRTAQSHAAFLLPHLSPGMSVLDLGCGPGTITVGLAAAVAPGPVVGVDQGSQQLDEARALAAGIGLPNLTFQAGSCYQIPVADGTVDRVLAHALIEHLADPPRTVAEIRRVLRPGGLAALCSPDWGGFLLSPPTAAVQRAVDEYIALMTGNGGDPLAGRRLGSYLTDAGFTEVRVDARYERYPDTTVIAGYLAAQLAEAGEHEAARTFVEWAPEPSAMFAQAWVSATGVLPA
jgi:ubiquinone/menaquinone biosynthesis C-methylase UbiE